LGDAALAQVFPGSGSAQPSLGMLRV